jgi:hypothetical protein
MPQEEIKPKGILLASGSLLTIALFIAGRAYFVMDAFSTELKTKASEAYVITTVETAKREIEAKRDADYRELRANLSYIKEGIDELKQRNYGSKHQQTYSSMDRPISSSVISSANSDERTDRPDTVYTVHNFGVRDSSSFTCNINRN